MPESPSNLQTTTHLYHHIAASFKTTPPPTRTFTHHAPKMAPLDSQPMDKDALAAHRPIVISGPSGAGKSTILQRLFADYPGKFGFSISHTTRGPRGTEQDGKEYYFVTKEEFLDLVERKGFVEHAQFGGNHYGTSIKAVNDIAERGQVCILDIEMEVCPLLRHSYRHVDVDAVSRESSKSQTTPRFLVRDSYSSSRRRWRSWRND